MSTAAKKARSSGGNHRVKALRKSAAASAIGKASAAMNKTSQLTVKLIPSPGVGFVAVCPEIEGAMSQGKTEAAAVENLMDAIKCLLVVRAEMALEKLSVPAKPRTRTFRLASLREIKRPAKAFA